jgi:hypothetical protein
VDVSPALSRAVRLASEPVECICAISLDADESDVVDEHGNHLAYVSPAYAMRGFRIERIRTTDVFLCSHELAR